MSNTTRRLGGITVLTIDGKQYSVRGNIKVSPNRVKREGVVGQDGVHGYTELPVVPFIEGEFTTVPGLKLQDLEDITHSTITAQLANGSTYVLTEAWTEAAFQIETAEGKFSAKFEGITCEEI